MYLSVIGSKNDTKARKATTVLAGNADRSHEFLDEAREADLLRCADGERH